MTRPTKKTPHGRPGMSDERMSEEEFDNLVARSICNPAIWTEARRARAEESRLAARVEVLEAALTALNAYEDFSSPLTECDDCSSCCGYEDPSGINEARAKARAALTPPTQKETKR